MGVMDEIRAFFWELIHAIWNNFNCAEGKIIFGAFIGFFLLISILIHLFGRDFKGALIRSAVALVNAVVFSFLATLHQGGPSFFTAFKLLGSTSVITLAIALVFALFSYLMSGSEGSEATSNAGSSTIYDQYGRPIDLHQVGGHYEDSQGLSYDVYGNRASAQITWMETEDGGSVQVHPDGNGYFSSYGHSYRLNSRGKLEEC